MRYLYFLIARIFLAFIIIFSSDLFTLTLLPLTIYPVFFFFDNLDYNVYIINDVLTINGRPAEFVESCLAGSAYMLLVLLILLTKDVSIKKGILMFISGGFAILIINIVRIIILLFILENFSYNLFNAVHVIIWLFVSSLSVFVLWLLIARYFEVKSIPVYSDFVNLIRIWKETFK